MTKVAVCVALAIAVVAPGARADSDPPSNLISGDAAHGSAIDPVFAHFKLDRLSCKFSEEKHIALLARPIKSTGTIFFDRDKGIARATVGPKAQQVVLTKTTLKIKKGDKTEEIPLDKSKDLKAFALIFPTLLRGERAELEKTFDMGLYGGDADWWALTFTPKTESLRKMVKRVVVFGRKDQVISLQIAEASGDTTDTHLTDILKNGDVKDAEIATAFGAP